MIEFIFIACHELRGNCDFYERWLGQIPETKSLVLQILCARFTISLFMIIFPIAIFLLLCSSEIYFSFETGPWSSRDVATFMTASQ